MIEDKELGLKISENPEEKFWTEIRDKCEKDLDISKKEQEINEYLLKFYEKKAKKSIASA